MPASAFSNFLSRFAATAAAAKTEQLVLIGQGSGPGFSCDVNTGYCECSGSWDGADCKGMFPNCKVKDSSDGTIWHMCEGGKCKCRMFRATSPQKVTPGHVNAPSKSGKT